MPRYAIDAEFHGRHFHGSQLQPGLRTVQGDLMAALHGLAGQTVAVRPASRLDAGVSARHFPCDAVLTAHLPPAALCHALNQRLAEGVSVRRAALVADDFHAMHHAQSKTYRYRAVVRRSRPSCDTARWWLCRPIDLGILHACAQAILGERDLGAFRALRRNDSDDDDPVRRILAAAWQHAREDGDDAYTFTITGTGFLYKQVRALVGAMCWTAGPYGDMRDFQRAVDSGDIGDRPADIAPAEGLCLMEVDYGGREPDWVGP